MNRFEIETQNSLQLMKQQEGAKFFYRRLPDTKSFQKVSKMAMFIKQPADFFAIHNGRNYLIECKSTKNIVSYCFDYIAEHQFEDLIEAKKAGGMSYFLLGRRGLKKGEMACFAVDPETMLYLRESFHKINRKSIKWNELYTYSIPLDRVQHEQAWDLRPLFGIRIGIVNESLIGIDVGSSDNHSLGLL